MVYRSVGQAVVSEPLLEPLRFRDWRGHFCADHFVGDGTGGYAISERLSFGYFSLARQRKVTAAPRRGDANRPTRSQVLRDTGSKPQTREKKPQNTDTA